MTTTFSPIFLHNSKYECVTPKRGIDAALHSPSGVPDGSLKNARRNRTGTSGSMVFAIWCSEVPGESKKTPLHIMGLFPDGWCTAIGVWYQKR